MHELEGMSLDSLESAMLGPSTVEFSALIAINPHKHVSSNANSVLQKHATEYQDASENKIPLPPHIFRLANNAYYHTRRTAQDQSLIISGETGSGKSENRRLAIKTLLEPSVPNLGKRGAKLANQVPTAEFAIESFDNKHLQSKRLSLWKIYRASVHRQGVSVPSGRRSFHIFHYLMTVASASPEERQHHLADKTQYRYLGRRAGAGACPNSAKGVGPNNSFVRILRHFCRPLKNQDVCLQLSGVSIWSPCICPDAVLATPICIVAFSLYG